MLVAVYGVQTIGIAVITAGIPFAAAELIITEGASGALATVYVLGAFSTAFALFVLGSMLSQAVWVALSAAIGKITTFAAGNALLRRSLDWLFPGAANHGHDRSRDRPTSL